jgi:hypothetical protein
MRGMGGDAREDVGEPSLQIDAILFAVIMRLYMAAARCPPRSDATS